MSLAPADLLFREGLVPDLGLHLGAFRYAQIALIVLWALVCARRMDARALAAGLLVLLFTFVFWTAALGRPYGLLVDAATTRRAAELSVAAASGSVESPVAGEPGKGWAPRAAAALRPSWRALLLAPLGVTLAAVVMLPVLVFVLGGPQGRLAALLWIAFSTGESDALAGVGFLSGAWAHPGAAALVTLALALALAADRIPRAGRFAALAVLVAACALAPGVASRRGPFPALIVLAVGQGLWPLLAATGWREAHLAGRAALASGATAVLVSALGPPIAEWPAHVVYRAGLVLCAAPAVARIAAMVGETVIGHRWLQRHAARLGDPAAVGTAALILALVPGSFLSSWNPKRMDEVYSASVEPFSANLGEALAFLRDRTPTDSVVLASRESASAVAVVAQRRVLRAPELQPAADDERRVRLERLVLEGGDASKLAERYALRYLLVAPGDFKDRGLAAPEELEGRGGLAPVFASPSRMRVYALDPP